MFKGKKDISLCEVFREKSTDIMSMQCKTTAIFILNAIDNTNITAFLKTRLPYFTHRRPLQGGAAEHYFVLSTIHPQQQ